MTIWPPYQHVIVPSIRSPRVRSWQSDSAAELAELLIAKLLLDSAITVEMLKRWK